MSPLRVILTRHAAQRVRERLSDDRQWVYATAQQAWQEGAYTRTPPAWFTKATSNSIARVPKGDPKRFIRARRGDVDVVLVVKLDHRPRETTDILVVITVADRRNSVKLSGTSEERRFARKGWRDRRATKRGGV